MILVPTYLLVGFFILWISIEKRKEYLNRPRFTIAAILNGLGLCPVIVFMFVALSGGHSTVQLSGSYEAWRLWLHLWPVFLFMSWGGMVIALVLIIISIFQPFRSRPGEGLFLTYFMLTFAHYVLVLQFLGTFFPDA